MIELNKYPFTETSHLVLTDLNYTLPLGLILDANFYPRCLNSPPFYVSDIIKEQNNSIMYVSSSSDDNIFTVVFDRSVNEGDFIFGHGIQNGTYCGSCTCSKDMLTWLESVPDLRNIAADSLIFSAAAVRPSGDVASPGSGELMYNNTTIDSLKWGNNLDGGTIEVTTIKTSDTSPDPVKSINVNGVSISGSNVYITPGKQSAIRVVNSGEITVGRLSEL